MKKPRLLHRGLLICRHKELTAASIILMANTIQSTIDPIAAMIQAALNAIAAIVQVPLDAVTALVQARFDEIASAVKTVGELGLSFRARLGGQGI